MHAICNHAELLKSIRYHALTPKPKRAAMCWEPMTGVEGETARLVDSFDVASVPSGVLRIIEDADYHRSLIENGLCNVQRFQPQVIAREFKCEYMTKGMPRAAGSE